MQPVKTRISVGIALVPMLFAACGIAALAQSTIPETPEPPPTVTAQSQVGASPSRELERPERWSVHTQSTHCPTIPRRVSCSVFGAAEPFVVP
jgi:hypothetical protein